MDLSARITIDPKICHGQVTIRGTRIPVSIILDNLAAGVAENEIFEEYPTLPPDAVRVALAYAARLAREEVAFLEPR